MGSEMVIQELRDFQSELAVIAKLLEDAHG